jgi:hypothetical protein
MKIKCVRVVEGDRDWHLKSDNILQSSYWHQATWVLCDGTASMYWDFDGAKEINVLVTRKSTPSSYKCKLVYGRFSIFCEDTGQWATHGLFNYLNQRVEKLLRCDHGEFYLGVEIVK